MVFYVFFNPFYNLIRVKRDRAIKIVEKVILEDFRGFPKH